MALKGRATSLWRRASTNSVTRGHTILINKPPALAAGTYGSRFDLRNTWWPYVGDYLEYLARNQYMLQQGEFVGDVLYYAGEDAPLAVIFIAAGRFLKTCRVVTIMRCATPKY